MWFSHMLKAIYHVQYPMLCKQYFGFEGDRKHLYLYIIYTKQMCVQKFILPKIFFGLLCTIQSAFSKNNKCMIVTCIFLFNTIFKSLSLIYAKRKDHLSFQIKKKLTFVT